MKYLTDTEYATYGFEVPDNFYQLSNRAEMIIDMYLRGFYDNVDFNSDFNYRRRAVKLAVAFQISYMNDSGILTADEKASVNNLTIGRTTINYGGSSDSNKINSQFNISLDAINILRNVGFSSIQEVDYDR